MPKKKTITPKKVKDLDEFVTLLRDSNHLFLAIPIEDASEYYRIMNSFDAFLALNALVYDEELRSWMKHGGIEKELMIEDWETKEYRPMDRYEVIDWMRQRILETVNEYVDVDRGMR